MTQLHSIFRSTAILAVARIVERCGSILVGIFIARRLGAGGLGTYSVALYYYNLIFLAAEMGATNFLIRSIARRPDLTGRYVTHVATMATTLAILAIAAFWFAVPHLSDTRETITSIYVVLFAIIPGAWRTIQEAVFVARERVQFITYSAMIAAAVNAGLSLVMLWLGYGVVALVAVFAAGQLVLALCYFIFISFHLGRLNWQFDLGFARDVVREIRPFAGSSLLGGLLTRPEVLILSLVSRTEQIGYYVAALKLAEIWQLLPQAYMTNVFPALSRSHEIRSSDFHMLIDRSLKYLLAIALPLSVGTFVAAKHIVHFLYGAGFDEVILPLQIVVWTIPLGFVMAVLWRALSAGGSQGTVFRVQLLVSVIRLGGGFVLIPGLGALGAAITSFGSAFCQNLLLTAALRRVGTRVSVIRREWRLVTSTLVMGAAVLALRDTLSLSALTGAAVVVYGILVVLTGSFTQQDVDPFRQLLTSRIEKQSVQRATTVP